MKFLLVRVFIVLLDFEEGYFLRLYYSVRFYSEVVVMGAVIRVFIGFYCLFIVAGNKIGLVWFYLWFM